MNILITYTHPAPKSFNHALLETVEKSLKEAGHTVRVKDLYAMPDFKVTLDGADFGQIMAGQTPADIKKEQEDVLWADGLVFIYPIWWFTMPAMLKGWIDRVMLNGFAFEYTDTGARGLLTHKKALVIQTTGAPEMMLEQNKAVALLERPFTDGILRFVGINNIDYKAFFGV
ncbi:MAG: NAD(P)H-dependent oxidoreductase, partial [Methylococcales bacterium]|nr:NAD(P)H-dependent oxidoreductase [Methylococcales bacterium]